MAKDRLTRILFILLLGELCLGGGGRFTAFGSVSLRMIFFALALFSAAYWFLRGGKISGIYWRLLALFLFTVAIGLSVGLFFHAERRLWWEDLKPLLYFLILPFFALTIHDKEGVRLVARIIQGSAISIMVLFFGILTLIHLQILPFAEFYNATVRTEEISFRGEYTFFYKGFLFLGIGIIFFYFNVRSQAKYWIIFLLLTALLLSFTRGFLLALSLVGFSHFLFSKALLKSLVMLAIAGGLLFFGGKAIALTSRWLDHDTGTTSEGNVNKDESLNPTLLGDRSFSDNERIVQIRQVVQGSTFYSTLIGHGFGIGVPSRPVHMEISYLEIFQKQGLIGLTFWATLLGCVWKKFRAAARSGLAQSLFFSSLFVFFQSFTNQYINNPIGLSVLLLSIVGLDQLKKEKTASPKR